MTKLTMLTVAVATLFITADRPFAQNAAPAGAASSACRRTASWRSPGRSELVPGAHEKVAKKSF